MEPIEYVKEKVFPGAVRRVLNRCASRLNRLWRIKYEDTPSPKVLETEEDVTIVLPRSILGAAGSLTQVGFGWSSIPFTGTGAPPSNQGLKIALNEGLINANIVPGNMASVFTLQNNKTQYLRCTTSQDAQGIVTAADLDVTLAMDADPSGTLDVAPATSSRALWQFVTAGNKITSSIALRIGGLDVYPVVTGMTCSSVLLRMVWSPAIATAP